MGEVGGASWSFEILYLKMLKSLTSLVRNYLWMDQSGTPALLPANQSTPSCADKANYRELRCVYVTVTWLGFLFPAGVLGGSYVRGRGRGTHLRLPALPKDGRFSWPHASSGVWTANWLRRERTGGCRDVLQVTIQSKSISRFITFSRASLFSFQISQKENRNSEWIS